MLNKKKDKNLAITFTVVDLLPDCWGVGFQVLVTWSESKKLPEFVDHFSGFQFCDSGEFEELNF